MLVVKNSSLAGLSMNSLYGVQTYASFNRIVQGMIASGELRIKPDEYVSAITIDAHGLQFQISQKD